MSGELDELVDAAETPHQLACPRQAYEGDVGLGESGPQRPQGRGGAQEVAQHEGTKDNDPPDCPGGGGWWRQASSMAGTAVRERPGFLARGAWRATHVPAAIPWRAVERRACASLSSRFPPRPRSWSCRPPAPPSRPACWRTAGQRRRAGL